MRSKRLTKEKEELLVNLVKDVKASWTYIASVLNSKNILTPGRGNLWRGSNLCRYTYRTLPELAPRCRKEHKGGRANNEYTDKVKGLRVCAVCKVEKDYWKDFYHQKKGKYRYPRPECKECWNSISKNKQNERHIDLYPDQYWQCDCFHVNPNNRKKCFKCKSEKSYV